MGALGNEPATVGVYRGVRGDDTYDALTHCVRGYCDWALDVSALIATIYRIEGGERDSALYDLGEAVAHASIQCESLGLHARQFATFDRGISENIVVCRSHIGW